MDESDHQIKAARTRTRASVDTVVGGAAVAVRRLESLDELLGLFPGDALVSAETDGVSLIAGWAAEATGPGVGASDGGSEAAGRAMAFAAPDYEGDELWLNAVGDAELVPGLVDAALAEVARSDELIGSGARIAGLTVPRGVALSHWGIKEGENSAWDLMAVDAPPNVQAAGGLVDVVADLEEVQAFLDAVNPHHSVRAADPSVWLWGGARDGASGPLLGVGALTRQRSGVPYLASIATAEAARGRGLGSAVTGFLTRRAFAAGERVCTLAHYHPNEAARRIYLRLGYRTTHQNVSGAFPAERPQ